MATLATLVASGSLVQLTVELRVGDLPERAIYGTPTFIEWLERDLPGLASDWNLDEDPAQQMDALLHEYITGGPMPFDRRFKPWWRAEFGVWYLKTADLRIFGWFPQLDHFIAAFGNTAGNVKQHALYHGYVTSVVRVRDTLDLDAPKFIDGSNPNAVLSVHD